MVNHLRHLGTLLFLLVAAGAAFAVGGQAPRAAETYRLTLPQLALVSFPAAAAPPVDETALAESLLIGPSDLPQGWSVAPASVPPGTPSQPPEDWWDPAEPAGAEPVGLATLDFWDGTSDLHGLAMAAVFLTEAQANWLVAETDRSVEDSLAEIGELPPASGLQFTAHQLTIPELGDNVSAWLIQVHVFVPASRDFPEFKVDFQTVTVVAARGRFVIQVACFASDGSDAEARTVALAKRVYAKLPSE